MKISLFFPLLISWLLPSNAQEQKVTILDREEFKQPHASVLIDGVDKVAAEFDVGEVDVAYLLKVARFLEAASGAVGVNTKSLARLWVKVFSNHYALKASMPEVPKLESYDTQREYWAYNISVARHGENHSETRRLKREYEIKKKLVIQSIEISNNRMYHDRKEQRYQSGVKLIAQAVNTDDEFRDFYKQQKLPEELKLLVNSLMDSKESR